MGIYIDDSVKACMAVGSITPTAYLQHDIIIPNIRYIVKTAAKKGVCQRDNSKQVNF